MAQHQLRLNLGQWLKIYEMWAWGTTESTPIYRWCYPYNDVPTIKIEIQEQTDNDNNWSDKYRSCIIEEIDKPPAEWLQKERDRIDNNITHLQAYRKFLDTQ